MSRKSRIWLTKLVTRITYRVVVIIQNSHALNVANPPINLMYLNLHIENLRVV